MQQRKQHQRPWHGLGNQGPIRETTTHGVKDKSLTYILFFDMAEIAETRGVRQSIVEAQKHPLNPVLRLGDIHEWDSMRASPWASRTVVYDEEDSLFKAWYYGSDGQPGPHRTGYATSGDGARWEKPALGLYEYNGSKENNISALGMGSVIKVDPSEKDDSRRYKMIMKGSGAVRMGYSPDGIHWDTDTRLDMNAMLDDSMPLSSGRCSRAITCTASQAALAGEAASEGTIRSTPVPCFLGWHSRSRRGGDGRSLGFEHLPVPSR